MPLFLSAAAASMSAQLGNLRLSHPSVVRQYTSRIRAITKAGGRQEVSWSRSARQKSSQLRCSQE